MSQIARTSDVWWKNAVFYCLDVETFQDGNGDGIGDFRGLTRRVDYLAGLGVTCLWLMPFHPSPQRDDGYDVTDYYGVDPRLGTLGDFVEFVRTAHDRGLRVIADLVVNHTSVDHPWFQSARRDPESPYRDWYVWREEVPEEEASASLIFPGQEERVWTWDEMAGAYYLHRFYRHQADLNVANPEVAGEIERIIGFWLQLGISGFRVDAVPYLLEPIERDGDKDLGPHDFLREVRAFLNRRRGDAMLLGEVNLEPEEARRFFGDEHGDELHMCLNFPLNQALALSLAREDAKPLRERLQEMPPLPRDAQWGNFVRNHDEWSLDKLSDEERELVFRCFGPEEEMQIFGRGLRRRLPTMLDGDAARLRLAYGLLFALPGSPVLFYGEEIGMGENLAIEGRLSVRSPMQWSPDPSCGFSPAPRERWARPPVEGAYGPEHVNVAAQRPEPESLLNWMERLIRQRKETPELGFGAPYLLDAGDPAVLALRYEWADRVVLVAHNLCGEARSVRLAPEASGDAQDLEPLFGTGDWALEEDGGVRLDLERFGSRWLRVRRKGVPSG